MIQNLILGSDLLFPLANRLRGRRVANAVSAEILQQTVRMPRNHGRCHLHGLVQGLAVTDVARMKSPQVAEALLSPRRFSPYWAGAMQLKVRTVLKRRHFRCSLQAKNVGRTPIPMGAGSHPNLLAPSCRVAAIALVIPAHKVIEIDNYKRVYPTGKIINVPRALDFRRRRPLRGRYLDNCYTDLILDSNGHAYAELYDLAAKQKIIVRALNKNVIAIQVYAPKNSPVVALELMTHLPDPREALWASRPTGMKLVRPGQTFRYGYSVEVQDL